MITLLTIYVALTVVVLLLNRGLVTTVWKKALFGEKGRRKQYFLTAMRQIFLWPLILIEKVISYKKG